MSEHDFSEFSDFCVNCALSRYDAEGGRCVPTTAEPERDDVTQHVVEGDEPL